MTSRSILRRQQKLGRAGGKFVRWGSYDVVYGSGKGVFVRRDFGDFDKARAFADEQAEKFGFGVVTNASGEKYRWTHPEVPVLYAVEGRQPGVRGQAALDVARRVLGSGFGQLVAGTFDAPKAPGGWSGASAGAAWDVLTTDNYDKKFSVRCGPEATVHFDQSLEAIGGTGDTENIHYMGFVSMMPPDSFLRLALPLSSPEQESLEFLRAATANGNPIAPAMLYLGVLEDDDAVTLRNGQTIRYRVFGHEGRHRATVLAERGCALMPVDVVVRYVRAHKLTENDLLSMNEGVVRQSNVPSPMSRMGFWAPMHMRVAMVNDRRYVF